MASMMVDRSNPTRAGNRVDWSDPQLQKLLSKIEDWDLDNRDNFPREEVQVQIGWSAGGGRTAVLVWKRDKVMVLEASFPIPTAEYVRVDRFYGDGMRSVWGVVVEGRAGRRAEDCSNGVSIYWLHEC
ncbi:hypothetical protein RHOFW104T7_06180 [Rhodanobacter thiooxydans]|uniref:Uncharacterized protein n=3 Tax=Rhodanobacteraceae TaxID=1775411 RepID=A0A154QLP7_9GAMM|nr:hypothetical protein R2APBS1_2519 [Rhodanobacter denitrificans]KZC18513.1 hypothetical protein RHOFW104R3_36145 [Rhodanobacter denitrificans]KZC24922.1 hypothetical protein RHOFW104T7_06180 [Rhodanobacter thiooxydans]